ncbi:laccase domain-containing protein [Eggerthellaceae bacterium zg-893]|nr:laccase domain-containing protein [Eggerthellaceae bacterium zg-893]
MLTDEALSQAVGVRIAFTGRDGGVSEGAFSSLNLGLHVSDDADAVLENRRRVLEALEVPTAACLTCNQVHGTHVVVLDDADDLAAVQREAREGCDGAVVAAANTPALLCFADCAPVIVVSPTGTFSVVHAGWRGAVAGIASKALRAMAQADGWADAAAYARGCNLYIGPHIGVECFECGPDVQQRFLDAFGSACVRADGHVSLMEAIAADACAAGASRERVACANACTRCNDQAYFSYRASGGVCGRHGAVAFRRED